MGKSTTVISQERFLDINGAERGVQVYVRDDGKVLWVSIDGTTVLRVCDIPLLEIDDRRKS